MQAGGSDLIFPHHEMCAAQGRVATDQPFAHAYLHSGMVGLDGEKMSKSKGNLVFVSALRSPALTRWRFDSRCSTTTTARTGTGTMRARRRPEPSQPVA